MKEFRLCDVNNSPSNWFQPFLDWLVQTGAGRLLFDNKIFIYSMREKKKIEFCAQILYMKPVLPHNLNNNGIESKLGDGTIVAAFRFAFAKFTNSQRRKWNN